MAFTTSFTFNPAATTLYSAYYNTTGYWVTPQETKEEKVTKILRAVDDTDRLKDILKLVKEGKLSEDDAVEKIQGDEQFHRTVAPKEYNTFQWAVQPRYTTYPVYQTPLTGTISAGTFTISNGEAS